MNTLFLEATQAGAIEQAAALLRAGELVVFPTDTVYGIGATIAGFAGETSPALAALYRAKARPAEKGIPLLLADESDIDTAARAVPPVARELAHRFWPGPLTLILPARADLPANLSPNENVALRIPDNAIARALIRAAGGVVAASSANRSGDPPATNGEEALAAFAGIAAAVVDGGPATHGQPSTIVDCTTTPPAVLRTGALPPAALGVRTVERPDA